jgi:chromosomal replication initiation ATPase DnaA
MTLRQLPLDLPVAPGYGPEDYIAGAANAEAVTWIESWPSWPAPGLVLVGPQRSGKTHAAMLWARRSRAAVIPAPLLRDVQPPAALGERRAIVVEDVDHGVDERALLHLYNLVVQRGGHIMLTALQRPVAWGMALPDLRSRIMALPTATLAAPDDELLERLLVKLFTDRQLIVPPDVISYLVKRIERSFLAAASTVQALDRAGLAAGRSITIALARRVLDQAPLERET